MEYSIEKPDPPSKEEWVAMISFFCLMLYTLNYPIAFYSSTLITLCFAGMVRLPFFKKRRFK